MGLHSKSTELREKFCTTPTFAGYTPSQKRFVDEFFAGRNLFLTGEAGTGKSFLMSTLFDFAQSNGMALAKTASTGIAAFNIGGQTIHSWAGLGLAEEDVNGLIAKVRKNKKASERIRAAQVLVLDEVSMVKGELLDKVDMVLKYFRFNNRPFGGIQIVLVGDMLQLPPIWKGSQSKDFAFNSRSWREAGIKAVDLKEKVRQDAATPFAALLSKIRVGNVEDLSLLKSRIDATFPDSEIEPVRIFCKNVDVNDYNRQRLIALPGKPHWFKSKDDGLPHYLEALDKNCPAPASLELKEGAQVMLLKNEDVDKGLVNGAIGVIKSFGKHGIVVKFRQTTTVIMENEWQMKEQVATVGAGLRYKVVATRVQYPLKLAYATSTHKVQGMTLDRAIVDMNEAFATGQVYTALSRVRNLESLSIVDFPISTIHANQECLAFYRSIATNA